MNLFRMTLAPGLGSRVGEGLLKCTDLAVALCLFLAPLWFGGRHDFGRLLYVCCVALATLSWSGHVLLKNRRRSDSSIGRESFQWSWAHSLCLGAIALVGFQLVPLPAIAMETLSPALAQIAPAWHGGSGFALHLGQWSTLSFTPSATTIGLSVLIAHVLLFFVVTARLQDEGAIGRLIMAIGLASALMAAFGIVQWLTTNGKLLWFYQHPQRPLGAAVQGSFANKNHFAHFVALGIGPAIAGWLLTKREKAKKKLLRQKKTNLYKVAWSIAVALSSAGVLLSVSRGGILSALLGLSLGLVFLIRGRWLTTWQAGAVAGSACVALLLVTFGDFGPLSKRLDSFTSGSLEEIDKGGGRREIWTANVSALVANPWFGYGVGSHADVYPAHINRGFESRFSHAESGYLHTTTETGLAGGALLVLAVGMVGRWCLKGLTQESARSRQALWAAVAAGLTTSVVHSLADFVWYIPACMSCTILLAACALRLHQTRAPRASYSSRQPSLTLGWGFAATAALISVANLWGPGRASFAWDDYLRASKQYGQLATTHSFSSPAESDIHQGTMRLLQDRMTESLRKVTARYPGHPHAQVRLAGRLIQHFELSRLDTQNAIGLVHIREAANASHFSSREATEAWLRVACGEEAALLSEAHQRTLKGLSLAPLQTDAYGYYADLCFLSPPSQRDLSAVIQQSVMLRPFDGDTLFEAGKQAWVAGDGAQAVSFWKRAHQVPGTHRLKIMAHLATRVPAKEYLDTFHPDWKTLSTYYRRYRRHLPEEDLTAIATYAANLAEQSTLNAAERNPSATGALVLASDMARELQNYAEAVRLARLAVDDTPASYPARQSLAEACFWAGNYEEAQTHIRWCLSRQPHNQALQERLKLVRKQQLAAYTDAASTTTVR